MTFYEEEMEAVHGKCYARIRELEEQLENERNQFGFACTGRKAAIDRADKLEAAARAVVDRWHTPLWKDVEATAVSIHALEALLTPAETSCEHDLQKPNCTVEVQQLAKAQRGECTVCHEVWINPPYGMLAHSSVASDDCVR